ncbi:methionyl-tRNA formyltransferase [Planctomicrobium sp. SH661]|uniref:methionyl-tRNA formyltransferase n=1 Tax=Planctomicrobium sp. SH661 TaxID=3448124 RepID=UPI003F5BDBCD
MAVALRVVMMGTGAFALPTFRALIQSEHDVAGLVTQPDRVGQGHHQHVNPLKELAQQHNIPVLQPVKANSPESLQALRDLQADLFVVAAYGQLLSAELLSIPRLGAINLHGSLLPKYRGAAPIQYSIWKGESEAGITIFQIEPRLDAGPMLGVLRTPIGPKETSGQLHDRLAELAPPLTLQVLQDLEAGTAQQLFQNAEQVTRAPRIKKEEGLINWHQTSQELGWHIRAMQPWPMPYSFLHLAGRKPQRMLILDIDPVDASGFTNAAPGSAITHNGELLVRTGDAAVRINQLQPAGKRAMSATDFLRGTPVSSGTFGPDCLEQK